MLLLCILMLLSNLALLGLGGYAYVKACRMSEDVLAWFAGFVSPKSENENSPLGDVIESAAEVVSQKIGVTVQAAIRGSIGGSMKGINAELEREAIAENPNLAVMDALPKSLKKNPLAMMGLQAVLSRMNLPGGGKSNSNGNSQARFNL